MLIDILFRYPRGEDILIEVSDIATYNVVTGSSLDDVGNSPRNYAKL